MQLGSTACNRSCHPFTKTMLKLLEVKSENRFGGLFFSPCTSKEAICHKFKTYWQLFPKRDLNCNSGRCNRSEAWNSGTVVQGKLSKHPPTLYWAVAIHIISSFLCSKLPLFTVFAKNSFSTCF